MYENAIIIQSLQGRNKMQATIVRTYFLDNLKQGAIDKIFNQTIVSHLIFRQDEHEQLIRDLRNANIAASLINFHVSLLGLFDKYAEHGLTSFTLNKSGYPHTPKNFVFLDFEEENSQPKIVKKANKELLKLIQTIAFPDKKSHSYDVYLMNIISNTLQINNNSQDRDHYLKLALGNNLYHIYTAYIQKEALNHTINATSAQNKKRI